MINIAEGQDKVATVTIVVITIEKDIIMITIGIGDRGVKKTITGEIKVMSEKENPRGIIAITEKPQELTKEKIETAEAI